MSEHVYGIKRLVGSSSEGSDAAVRNALAKAAAEGLALRWFEVVDTRGHIENSQVAHWQVTVDIGYQS
jgi:dodecin